MITARGGSTRVPDKNLKQIGGLSLIGYKARSALKSKYCTRLMISTDSEEIQQEAQSHGVEAPFLRPAHLASDTATSDDVILHVIEYCKTVEKRRYDAIMLLEPSSPFGRMKDYDAAVEIYLRHDASLVVGMKRTEVSSTFSGPLQADGNARDIATKFIGRDKLRTQDMRPEYTMNGAFYLIDWDAMSASKKIYSDPQRIYGLPMERAYSTEIDEPMDLLFAEFLIENKIVDAEEWT